MESPIIQDYSNPQQGSDMMAASPGNVQNNGESPARKAFTRMAPTRRDDRKIFVGGLPSNGTIVNSWFLDICSESVLLLVILYL